MSAGSLCFSLSPSFSLEAFFLAQFGNPGSFHDSLFARFGDDGLFGGVYIVSAIVTTGRCGGEEGCDENSDRGLEECVDLKCSVISLENDAGLLGFPLV